MKLAGIVNVTNPVKGAFSQGDGETILLDFTQGAHGRAFCGVRTYDLPDPKAQLVTVSNPGGTVEISGPHGVAAQMGNVSVRTLKANGDINLPGTAGRMAGPDPQLHQRKRGDRPKERHRP